MKWVEVGFKPYDHLTPLYFCFVPPPVRHGLSPNFLKKTLLFGRPMANFWPSQEDSLKGTNPMFITMFVQFQPKVHAGVS